MKRKTRMWVVLIGFAAIGIALAMLTKPYFRVENTESGETAKISAVVKNNQKSLDSGAPKPSPEQIKEVQGLKELGPNGQKIATDLAWAWLGRMDQRKVGDDAAEFTELSNFLLSIDPAAAKTCVDALRKTQSPTDRPFEMRLLATFGKSAVGPLMSAMEQDARRAGDNFALAAKSPFPPALAKMVQDALPAVRGALRHEDPAVRRQALRTLALMGQEGKERVLDAVPDVEFAFKDKDKSVRAFAALALAEVVPPYYTPSPVVMNALTDSDSHVRLSAARTLGPQRSVDLQHVAEVVATLLKGEPFNDTWWKVVDGQSVINAYAVSKGGKDYNPLFWDETAAHVLLSLGPKHNLPPETIVELLRSCRHDGRHLMTLLAAQGTRASVVVPELAAMIKDPDYPQRRKALLTLGRLGKPVAIEAMPDVLAALHHRDGRTRWQAFLALMQLDPAAAREKFPTSLHPAINAASGAVNRTNFTKVSHWTRCLWIGGAAILVPATNASADVDQLGLYRTPTDLDILAENDRLDNMLAVLNRTPALGKEAVPFLLDFWQGTDKQEALAVLVKIGAAGIPALTKVLDDPAAKDMHLKVLEVFQSLGPKAKPAVPALVRALTGSNEELCDKAAKTFSALGEGGSEAVPALCKLLKGNKSEASRHAADALGFMGPAAKSALPDLIELFGSDNKQLAAVAVRAVSRIGKDAVEPLTEALKNSQASVRLSAVRSLALLNDATQPALPSLRELAQNDPSAEVRTEAGELLKRWKVQ